MQLRLWRGNLDGFLKDEVDERAFFKASKIELVEKVEFLREHIEVTD
jgi:hypothetical protein